MFKIRDYPGGPNLIIQSAKAQNCLNWWKKRMPQIFEAGEGFDMLT